MERIDQYQRLLFQVEEFRNWIIVELAELTIAVGDNQFRRDFPFKLEQMERVLKQWNFLMKKTTPPDDERDRKG